MTAKKRSKKTAKKTSLAKPKEKKKKMDWEVNQQLISKHFIILMGANNTLPTHKELAEATGLSESTIERHLKTSRFTKLIERMRGMTDMAVMTFTKKVLLSEDVKMWKLYFQLTEGFIEKKAVDVTSKGKQIQQVTGFVIADEKDTSG